MVPGKQYLFKHTNKTVPGTINTLRYRVDVNTLRRDSAPTLTLNEIGRCQISLNQSVVFDPYRKNRVTGAMIVLDRLTNRTVGAAMIVDRTTSDAEDYWEGVPASELLSTSPA